MLKERKHVTFQHLQEDLNRLQLSAAPSMSEVSRGILQRVGLVLLKANGTGISHCEQHTNITAGFQ